MINGKWLIILQRITEHAVLSESERTNCKSPEESGLRADFHRGNRKIYHCTVFL